MKPSLLDLFITPAKLKLVAPAHLVGFKFKFYIGEDKFKGTNDEPIGWNSKKPGWFGFVTKAGHRWYVHRDDLTPESLQLALRELAEKEKGRAERSQRCRERSDAVAKARGEAKKQRGESSALDGREAEIRKLQESKPSLNRLAIALGVARGTLVRKLEKMEKECD